MRVTALVPVDAEPLDAGVHSTLPASGCVDEVLLVSRSSLDIASLGAATDLLVVHDPKRALVSAEVIRSVVDTVRSGESAAAPAQQVTDTIKIVEPGDLLRGTWDRHRLREIHSPLCCRLGLVADLGRVPELGDLPPGRVRLVPGEPRTSSNR